MSQMWDAPSAWILKWRGQEIELPVTCNGHSMWAGSKSWLLEVSELWGSVCSCSITGLSCLIQPHSFPISLFCLSLLSFALVIGQNISIFSSGCRRMKKHFLILAVSSTRPVFTFLFRLALKNVLDFFPWSITNVGAASSIFQGDKRCAVALEPHTPGSGCRLHPY